MSSSYCAVSFRTPWAWLLSRGVKLIENRDTPIPAAHLNQYLAIHCSSKFGTSDKRNCLHPLVIYYLQKFEPNIFGRVKLDLSVVKLKQCKNISDLLSKYAGLERNILNFFRVQCGRISGLIKFSENVSSEKAIKVDPEFCDFPLITQSHWVVDDVLRLPLPYYQLPEFKGFLGFPSVNDDAILTILNQCCNNASSNRVTIRKSKEINDDLIAIKEVSARFLIDDTKSKQSKSGADSATAAKRRKKMGGGKFSFGNKSKMNTMDLDFDDSEDEFGEGGGGGGTGGLPSQQKKSGKKSLNDGGDGADKKNAVSNDKIDSESGDMSDYDSDMKEENSFLDKYKISDNRQRDLRTLLLQSRDEYMNARRNEQRSASNVLHNMNSGQWRRYECYSRSTLNRNSVKQIMANALELDSHKKINDKSAIVMQALSKSIVMELVAHSRQIQKECIAERVANESDDIVMSERDLTLDNERTFGPIRPCHIREALRRLENDPHSFL